MASERIFIPGPEGVLEAELSDRTAGGGLAILCHPHPQYGGSMDDDVLGGRRRRARARGHRPAPVQLPRRGRQRRQLHGGEGELLDLTAVLGWAAEELAPADLLLGGYSFGAAVTARLPEQVGASRLLLIAPPTAATSLSRPAIAAPVHVIYGDRDGYVDAAAFEEWAQTTVHPVAGADHFFGGCGAALGDALRAALA